MPSQSQAFVPPQAIEPPDAPQVEAHEAGTSKSDASEAPGAPEVLRP